MYGYRIQQSMDQPGKVANPSRGKLSRENKVFPVLVRILYYSVDTVVSFLVTIRGDDVTY